MLKTLKNSLYKSVLASDFFLLQGIYKQSLYLKKIIKHKEILSSLNMYELIKSLKLFIRSVQFLKNTPRPIIYITVDAGSQYDLVTAFVKKYKSFVQIYVKDTHIFKYKAKKSTLLLALEKQRASTKQNYFLNLTLHHVFLVTTVMTRNEYGFGGFYNIYNDLYDFKKIIFLIIILNNILGTPLKQKKNAVFK